MSCHVSRMNNMGCHMGQIHYVPYLQRPACIFLQVYMQATASQAVSDMDASDALQVVIDNQSDAECTVVTVEGKDQPHLLMSLSGAFITAGYVVISASISSDDGRVLDVFRVKKENKKVGGEAGALMCPQ